MHSWSIYWRNREEGVAASKRLYWRNLEEGVAASNEEYHKEWLDQKKEWQALLESGHIPNEHELEFSDFMNF